MVHSMTCLTWAGRGGFGLVAPVDFLDAMVVISCYGDFGSALMWGGEE
jgi:hypothetical protein